MLGKSRGVTITKDETTIVDGNGNENAIMARLEEIKSQIEKAESTYAREQLQQRLAKLAGGVAIINVGGHTEAEMKERKDRVDDALHATKAAIEEGIIPGGGLALLHSAYNTSCETKNYDEELGCNIMKSVLQKPFEQILINAGLEDEVHSIKYSILGQESKNVGYDIKASSLINLFEAGIIDPTKVTRCALENAVSVAGTILITECVVVDKPEEKVDSEPSMF
jgi:chaperonin GroEL